MEEDDNVVLLKPEFAPIRQRINILKALPSEELGEKLAAFYAPSAKEKLAQTGIFLYSDRFMIAEMSRTSKESIHFQYDHGIGRDVHDYGHNLNLPFRQRLQFKNLNPMQRQGLRIGVTVEPPAIDGVLGKALCESDFLDEDGLLPFHVPIQQEALADLRQLYQSREELLKFIIGTSALKSFRNVDQRVKNADAKIVQLEMGEEVRTLYY